MNNPWDEFEADQERAEIRRNLIANGFPEELLPDPVVELSQAVLDALCDLVKAFRDIQGRRADDWWKRGEEPPEWEG